MEHVDYSETRGIVRFAQGRWTLGATSDTLTLRVEADDEDALRRLQEGISGRLEKIGRRDRLKVTWQPPGAPDAAHPGSSGGEPARPPRPQQEPGNTEDETGREA